MKKKLTTKKDVEKRCFTQRNLNFAILNSWRIGKVAKSREAR